MEWVSIYDLETAELVADATRAPDLSILEALQNNGCMSVYSDHTTIWFAEFDSEAEE
jgi:hypothetical protein